MTPEEEIARLKAENTALREQVEGLQARVQELEASPSHTRACATTRALF